LSRVSGLSAQPASEPRRAVSRPTCAGVKEIPGDRACEGSSRCASDARRQRCLPAPDRGRFRSPSHRRVSHPTSPPPSPR